MFITIRVSKGEIKPHQNFLSSMIKFCKPVNNLFSANRLLHFLGIFGGTQCPENIEPLVILSQGS